MAPFAPLPQTQASRPWVFCLLRGCLTSGHTSDPETTLPLNLPLTPPPRSFTAHFLSQSAVLVGSCPPPAPQPKEGWLCLSLKRLLPGHPSQWTSAHPSLSDLQWRLIFPTPSSIELFSQFWGNSCWLSPMGLSSACWPSPRPAPHQRRSSSRPCPRSPGLCTCLPGRSSHARHCHCTHTWPCPLLTLGLLT